MTTPKLTPRVLRPNQLLSRAQAAQILGVTVRTIDRKRESGLLKAHIAPIGRGLGGTRVFFLVEEIESLKQLCGADGSAAR